MNGMDDLETLMSQAPRLETEKVGASLQRLVSFNLMNTHTHTYDYICISILIIINIYIYNYGPHDAYILHKYIRALIKTIEGLGKAACLMIHHHLRL